MITLFLFIAYVNRMSQFLSKADDMMLVSPNIINRLFGSHTRVIST